MDTTPNAVPTIDELAELVSDASQPIRPAMQTVDAELADLISIGESIGEHGHEFTPDMVRETVRRFTAVAKELTTTAEAVSTSATSAPDPDDVLDEDNVEDERAQLVLNVIRCGKYPPNSAALGRAVIFALDAF